ncbi:hypothetical protein BKA93DRAFT_504765 [Sparassis latifolia]
MSALNTNACNSTRMRQAKSHSRMKHHLRENRHLPRPLADAPRRATRPHSRSASPDASRCTGGGRPRRTSDLKTSCGRQDTKRRGSLLQRPSVLRKAGGGACAAAWTPSWVFLLGGYPARARARTRPAKTQSWRVTLR